MNPYEIINIQTYYEKPAYGNPGKTFPGRITAATRAVGRGIQDVTPYVGRLSYTNSIELKLNKWNRKCEEIL